MSKIGIGVIGCGKRINDVLKRVLNVGDDVVIRALCDNSPDAITATRKDIAPQARVYEDHQELCQDPAVDWVFIGSFNCFHRQHAIAALQAGKHVFCEKPLATTLEDCLAIRDAWAKTDRVFAMGFVLRYSPHYQAIRDILQKGLLGRIVSMEFNETLHFEHGGFIHSDWRRHTRLAGTHLLEKCCHDIDLCQWLIGSLPLRAASFGGLDFFVPENEKYIERIGPNPQNGRPAFLSWTTKRKIETTPFTPDKDIVDNQVAILEFANNVRATFHTNCMTNIPERRMYFCGTEGTLRADVLAGKIEYRRIGHTEELQQPATGASGGHGSGDTVLTASLYSTLTEGTPPLSTPDDGVTSAITAFGIDQAMETGTVLDLRPMWEKAGISV